MLHKVGEEKVTGKVKHFVLIACDTFQRILCKG